MKTIKITIDDENIKMKSDGVETFELLGIIYFLEQDLKVRLLQSQRKDKQDETKN